MTTAATAGERLAQSIPVNLDVLSGCCIRELVHADGRGRGNYARAESLERELLKLPGAFKTLALKHKEDLLRLGLQPSGSRLSVQKLLQIVSEDDEYRKAVLAHPDQAKSEADRIRETATSRPSGAVSGVETLVTKEDILKSRDKRYGDQPNLGSIITKLLKDIKGRGS